MPDPDGTFQFITDRGDSRLRLDQVLARRVTSVTHMSRSVAQKWIEAGAVKVDGRAARRSSDRVREHATITVAFPPDTILRSIPEPEPGSLDVLYEDDTFIAINKPAGMVVHPSYKQLSGTLLNTVLWHVRERNGARPGILTRLDKDTSGVVVIAFAEGAHAAMQRDAAAGRIRKEYLAIVHGSPHPPAGVIREPLGRDPSDRRRVVVAAGGAESETRYEVVRSLPGDLSLVRCELVTGRTHQIRVHLSNRGWPIAGDRLYGGASDVMPRQALHAWRVALPHPVTREPLAIEAPLPQDFSRISC
ncbi:MAG TPA: RluA family pseudouridine synthase [Vicinamibacterales bacterium]|nr:RluA family pseudouridine synthase [Vicinamibacterales bacterium]